MKKIILGLGLSGLLGYYYNNCQTKSNDHDLKKIYREKSFEEKYYEEKSFEEKSFEETLVYYLDQDNTKHSIKLNNKNIDLLRRGDYLFFNNNIFKLFINNTKNIYLRSFTLNDDHISNLNQEKEISILNHIFKIVDNNLYCLKVNNLDINKQVMNYNVLQITDDKIFDKSDLLLAIDYYKNVNIRNSFDKLDKNNWFYQKLTNLLEKNNIFPNSLELIRYEAAKLLNDCIELNNFFDQDYLNLVIEFSNELSRIKI